MASRVQYREKALVGLTDLSIGEAFANEAGLGRPASSGPDCGAAQGVCRRRAGLGGAAPWVREWAALGRNISGRGGRPTLAIRLEHTRREPASTDPRYWSCSTRPKSPGSWEADARIRTAVPFITTQGRPVLRRLVRARLSPRPNERMSYQAFIAVRVAVIQSSTLVVSSRV